MADKSYPRDLAGYGRTPPHANWPGRARVAVQFVVNYEEGGENCVLHGDPGSEQFLSEIIGAAAYPARHLSMESIYEYGARAGVWRILREFERRVRRSKLAAFKRTDAIKNRHDLVHIRSIKIKHVIGLDQTGFDGIRQVAPSLRFLYTLRTRQAGPQARNVFLHAEIARPAR